jgi:hypothetical protein
MYFGLLFALQPFKQWGRGAAGNFNAPAGGLSITGACCLPGFGLAHGVGAQGRHHQQDNGSE